MTTVGRGWRTPAKHAVEAVRRHRRDSAAMSTTDGRQTWTFADDRKASA